eukprot:Plantae.Rhodophyta-Purpureofilum_apyrenoidigerum.ctg36966.p1 GENE.Plantae.Rhodophyta-Purpureofilum_apyrenoidigerum.ctg36966~~Plantae.Rhodophyta-Purpureofilum_apyrenoidigerum.ctg36966.p1  ORF type:complete len:242 (+),score=43.95 Plantae.Rhodophyta-Purpureofilum_apyrenoidigerum.ctg36966:84-728(+)
MGLPSFFVVLVYVSGYLFLLFAAVCLACGFYYLAELAEEYTSWTKKLLKVLVAVELFVFLLLWAYERFAFGYCAISFLAHAVYFQLLRTFPFMRPRSPEFISSVLMFVVSNVAWYRFFTTKPEVFYNYRLSPMPSIASFFLICVWMVPIGFFVSLTINDSVLPGAGLDAPGVSRSDPDSKQKKARNLVAATAQEVMRIMRNMTGKPARQYNTSL